MFLGTVGGIGLAWEPVSYGSNLCLELPLARSSGSLVRRVNAPAFDCVGDIHGCLAALTSLLENMGYAIGRDSDGVLTEAVHPAGRMLLFVGDYVDRGPRPLDTLFSVLNLVASGAHAAVRGNHEDFLLSWLSGRIPAGYFYPGFEPTYDALEKLDSSQRSSLRLRLAALPFEILASPPGDASLSLVITHAGLFRADVGRVSPDFLDSLLLGRTSDRARLLLESMDVGAPDSGSWLADWAFTTDGPWCVVGHVPLPRALVRGRLAMIDTGAVYGDGRLTAFRFPEARVTSVPGGG